MVPVGAPAGQAGPDVKLSWGADYTMELSPLLGLLTADQTRPTCYKLSRRDRIWSPGLTQPGLQVVLPLLKPCHAA